MRAARPAKGLVDRVRRRLVGRRRSAFAQCLRPGDVFIVTFPKSGTSWLGYMIADLVTHGDGTVRTLQGAEVYVPDVNDAYFSDGSFERPALPGPSFFRVHAPYDRRLPRVVYIVRDPRDVLVSYFHWKRLMSEDFDATLTEFVAGEHWPTDWGTHVAGWTERRHPALFVTSYERLKEAPEAVLRQVVDFAGLKCDESAVRRAVAAADFERMRVAEERTYAAGELPSPFAGERFVRRGIVGGWRDELDDESLAAIETRYGSVMKRLGYELSSSQA